MTGSKILGVLAASYEMGRIGSAMYLGVVAAVSQIMSRGRPFLSDVPKEHVGDDADPRQQIIVLSNREPCIHQLTASGEIVCRRPASGLVTALEPVVQACGGVWVAHGSGSADGITCDHTGHVKVEAGGASYMLRRVWLSADEVRGYYDGFANEGLWPLCHMAFSAPVFRRSDWIAYERVNRRFADTIAHEIGSNDPLILVQDYHFALVPRLLRERCPDATVVAFWHIPWPHADQFSLCPYGRDIIEGLLGADVIGFQTPTHCRNFLNCAGGAPDPGVDRPCRHVSHEGRIVQVRPYPISVEWPNRWTLEMPAVDECRRAVRADFGIDQTCALVVSVDRLDYTKGLEERLAAIERLLEERRSQRPVAFLQVAAPTRVAISRYAELAARVRGRIGQINERFGSRSFRPVTYVEQYTEPADIFRYYRAADVCYVGSLDDGMNLVAKEFIAARDDERGALVLSRFAGAARELTDAFIVNPYDIDGVADALQRALTSTAAEQQSRMRAMRRWVGAHNVHHWAREILTDAARVRDFKAMDPRAGRPHVM
jgi:trehalose 6-phosphate synthase